jgi:hypothetical protein
MVGRPQAHHRQAEGSKDVKSATPSTLQMPDPVNSVTKIVHKTNPPQ